MIRELDIVVLAKDLEAYHLYQGDVGTVVHCYTTGTAFEVEFVTGEGKTIAVVTLTESEIRQMRHQEILHARAFVPAL
ncbi:MAG: DUF4926 domain-containing protein [Anaerolineales bacterium]